MHSSMINYHLRGTPGFWGCFSYVDLAYVLPQISWGYLIVHIREHWVAVYVHNQTLIVLETLGLNKGNMRFLCNELDDYHILVNKVQVQSDLSEACGMYCILFVKWQISCICDFNQFLSLFSCHHLCENDQLLYELLK